MHPAATPDSDAGDFRSVVLSTNTGGPKEYSFNGTTIRSSMQRTAVAGGIRVTFNCVIGDKFDAAKVHGVRESVVYGLASDFFPDISSALERPVTIGSFGENLTMDHLDEAKVMIGDEYEAGSVRLKVTGPRSPCNRLNFAFQNSAAQDCFIQFGRPGVYFEVLQEGEIKIGDVLRLSESRHSKYSVSELFRLWKIQREVALGRREIETVREEFRQLVADDSISEFLRSRFRKSI